MPNPRRRAYIEFAAVVALWASTPLLMQWLENDHLEVLFILAAASAFATAALVPGAAMTGRLREARSYGRRDWSIIAGMGLLGIVCYTSLYYFAFRFAPKDEVTVVNYLWPVLLVGFAGPILGERHRPRVWLGLALSFIGTAGLMTDWRFTLPTGWRLVGYVSAAAGAACWALFSNFGKRLRYDKLASMALYSLVGTIVFGIALLVAAATTGGGAAAASGGSVGAAGGGVAAMGGGVAAGFARMPDAAGWLRLLYLGAVVNGLAYFLWFEALAGGPTALFGNLIFATPFLALVYLRIFVGTPLRGGVWLSLALIVAGAVISIHSAQENVSSQETKGT
jgi:drug/metabolite transporter (DMT)-like permease